MINFIKSKFFNLGILGFFLVIFLISNPVYAHRSGCHRWHSCPSDSSSYTCGDLGYPCQYPTYPASGGVIYPPSGYYKDCYDCPLKKVPNNAYTSGSGLSWSCDSGYKKIGDTCEKIVAPTTIEIRLLKLIGNPTVYEVINGGQAKFFTSAQEFLGKGYKWSEIEIVEQSELSKYLTSDTAIETSQTIEINTKALILRAGPSTEDKKLGITYQGEKYAVLGSQNGWYKIEKNGLSGWVYGGYVK